MSLLSSFLNLRAVRSISAVLDRRIIENASALYAAQIANYILPLVMLPYLARVLGPDVWGVVVFIQAIGMYLLLVIDYAFDISSTRDVARHQEDGEELARIVAGVLGARLILTAAALLVVAAAQLLTPALRDLGWLLWLGVFWFAVAAFRPFWFFLGLERVRGVLALEVILKTLGVTSVVFLVNSPADAWKVFAVQGVASGVSVLAAMILMYRIVRIQMPSLSGAVRELTRGWNLFIYQASASVYGMSNTLILGFLAAPVAVAYYAGAERIIGVLVRSIHPATQAMFPRASTLARENPEGAARFARTSITGLFCLTFVGASVLFLLAPHIVRVGLGPGYDDTVPVLRILLLVIPIMGIRLPLSTHWMVPNGHDGILKRITIGVAAFHIPAAIFLGTNFAQIGMAWALVFTEALILILALAILTLRGLGPFSFAVANRATRHGSKGVQS